VVDAKLCKRLTSRIEIRIPEVGELQAQDAAPDGKVSVGQTSKPKILPICNGEAISSLSCGKRSCRRRDAGQNYGIEIIRVLGRYSLRECGACRMAHANHLLEQLATETGRDAQ
jgi:hypothetical protein